MPLTVSLTVFVTATIACCYGQSFSCPLNEVLTVTGNADNQLTINCGKMVLCQEKLSCLLVKRLNCITDWEFTNGFETTVVGNFINCCVPIPVIYYQSGLSDCVTVTFEVGNFPTAQLPILLNRTQSKLPTVGSLVKTIFKRGKAVDITACQISCKSTTQSPTLTTSKMADKKDKKQQTPPASKLGDKSQPNQLSKQAETPNSPVAIVDPTHTKAKVPKPTVAGAAKPTRISLKPQNYDSNDEDEYLLACPMDRVLQVLSESPNYISMYCAPANICSKITSCFGTGNLCVGQTSFLNAMIGNDGLCCQINPIPQDYIYTSCYTNSIRGSNAIPTTLAPPLVPIANIPQSGTSGNAKPPPPPPVVPVKLQPEPLDTVPVPTDKFVKSIKAVSNGYDIVVCQVTCKSTTTSKYTTPTTIKPKQKVQNGNDPNSNIGGALPQTATVKTPLSVPTVKPTLNAKVTVIPTVAVVTVKNTNGIPTVKPTLIAPVTVHPTIATVNPTAAITKNPSQQTKQQGQNTPKPKSEHTNTHSNSGEKNLPECEETVDDKVHSNNGNHNGQLKTNGIVDRKTNEIGNSNGNAQSQKGKKNCHKKKQNSPKGPELSANSAIAAGKTNEKPTNSQPGNNGNHNGNAANSNSKSSGNADSKASETAKTSDNSRLNRVENKLNSKVSDTAKTEGNPNSKTSDNGKSEGNSNSKTSENGKTEGNSNSKTSENGKTEGNSNSKTSGKTEGNSNSKTSDNGKTEGNSKTKSNDHKDNTNSKQHETDKNTKSNQHEHNDNSKKDETNKKGKQKSSKEDKKETNEKSKETKTQPSSKETKTKSQDSQNPQNENDKNAKVQPTPNANQQAALISLSTIPKCFSGDMTVVTDRGKVRMDQLQINDLVSTSFGVSGQTSADLEAVRWFIHRNPQLETEFVTISTKSNRSISLSSDHLLPIISQRNFHWESQISPQLLAKCSIPAGKAKIGQFVLAYENRFYLDKILTIKIERKIGIYAPITKSGTIIVNDILASVYSGNVNVQLQQVVFQLIEMLPNWVTQLLQDSSSNDIPLPFSILHAVVTHLFTA